MVKRLSDSMHTYKIQYKDGTNKIVTAKTTLEVIKKYDLATKANINTQIHQLNQNKYEKNNY
jgi:hypothetical protein